jgi:hypothetical protein
LPSATPAAVLSMVPPLIVSVPLPRAVLLLILRYPVGASVTPPEKLLLPASVSGAGPFTNTGPLPPIAPANTCGLGLAKTSATLFVTRPGTEPLLLAPSPNCSVPPEMVVPPVKVLVVLLSTNVPGPATTRLPEPLMALL